MRTGRFLARHSQRRRVGSSSMPAQPARRGSAARHRSAGHHARDTPGMARARMADSVCVRDRTCGGRERTCDRRGRRTPLGHRAPGAPSSPASAPHPPAPAASSTLPDVPRHAASSRAHIQGSVAVRTGAVCAPTAPMCTRPWPPDRTVLRMRARRAACGSGRTRRHPT